MYAIGINLEKTCQINENYYFKVLNKESAYIEIKHELRTHVAIYLLFEKAKTLEEFKSIKVIIYKAFWGNIVRLLYNTQFTWHFFL